MRDLFRWRSKHEVELERVLGEVAAQLTLLTKVVGGVVADNRRRNIDAEERIRTREREEEEARFEVEARARMEKNTRKFEHCMFEGAVGFQKSTIGGGVLMAGRMTSDEDLPGRMVALQLSDGEIDSLAIQKGLTHEAKEEE